MKLTTYSSKPAPRHIYQLLILGKMLCLLSWESQGKADMDSVHKCLVRKKPMTRRAAYAKLAELAESCR